MPAMAMLLPSSAAAVSVGGTSMRVHGAAASVFGVVPLGVRVVGGGIGFCLSRSKETVAARMQRIMCQASEKEKIEGSRKNQMQATELFAELLKANDVRAVAKEHVASLSEDFFVIASAYLDLLKNKLLETESEVHLLASCDVRKAKKEGNVEVVNRLETTLQTALSVKESTLRPEIRLLNQLLRQNNEKERSNTIRSNLQYLAPESYFFPLLGRMIGDVERQTNNPRRLELLSLLRDISKETKGVNKPTKKSKGFGT